MRNVLLSVSFAILTACGGGGGGGSSSTSGVTIGTQTYANTSQAANLIVAPTGTTVSFWEKFKSDLVDTVYAMAGIASAYAHSPTNSVFQLNSAGTSTQISATEVSSGSFSSTLTTGIIDSSNFILIGYSNLSNSSGKSCALIGIRKSDDKIACIDFSPRCDSINNCRVNNYASQVKVSSDGNTFYAVKGDGGLSKINLADPWNPVITDIFTHAAVGDASFPLVNANGDVFTCINLMSTSNIACRIFGLNGTTTQIATARPYCAFFDSTNNFYYSTAVGDGSYNLNKLTFNSGNFSSASIVETLASPPASSALAIDCRNVVQFSGRTFAVHLYNPGIGSNSPNLFEFKSATTANSRNITLNANSVYQTDLQSHTNGLVTLGVAADGSGVIERYDVATDTVTTVLPTINDPTKYTITSMTVHPTTGIVKFTGSTLIGNQAVIGTIDGATNAISIKNSTSVATAIVGMR
jgi:hypothetical protein